MKNDVISATVHDTVRHPPTRGFVDDLDTQIRRLIAVHGEGGRGMRIAELAQVMASRHNVQISQLPEKTWRGYLSARAERFEVDPEGAGARVRFKSSGFACGGWTQRAQ